MISGGFMKRKYVELNTNNINEYSDNARNDLSYYIAIKKENLWYVNHYNKKLNTVDEELNDVLKYIESIISEINNLSKRISSLEKGMALLAYNHNLYLDSKDKSSVVKINASRYYYLEIMDELNNLISYRNKLRVELKDYKNRKNILVSKKKDYNKKLNSFVRNVDICNYTINSSYKVLNRLDNIYSTKIDTVCESYITPKVKRIK